MEYCIPSVSGEVGYQYKSTQTVSFAFGMMFVTGYQGQITGTINKGHKREKNA